MKRFTLSSVFILLLFTSYAKMKPEEVPGYYITANGDPLKGKRVIYKVSETFDSLITYKFQFKDKFIHT